MNSRFMITIFLAAIGLAVVRPAGSTSSSIRSQQQAAVTFRQEWIGGVQLQIVDANLADPRVTITPQMAAGGAGSGEPCGRMIERSRPTAAINGAYFSTAGMTPIGDIVIRGQIACRGDFKTALVVTRDRHASIERHPLGARVNWKDCDTVLACGPALVLKGQEDWEADAHNHHDVHVTRSVWRMGIGITPDQHILLVAANGPLSFGQWAHVMKELGCRDAMNLDAGASRLLYYRGTYLARPGRDLTNLLLIYETPPPDIAVLSPTRTPARISSAPIATLPADAPDTDTTAVPVRLCGESGKLATAWCPATVTRRLKPGQVSESCKLHRPPPGEKG